MRKDPVGRVEHRAVILARWGLAGLLLGLLAADLAPEKVTLNSYLPAPSGIYGRLITTGSAYLARDPDGKVGIGTASPTAKLDVAQDIRFASGRGELSDRGGDPVLGSMGGSPLVFAVDGSEKARLTPGGNLGIGTQSPATKLEVDGVLAFTASGGGYARICEDVAYEGYAGGAFTFCPGNATPLRRPADYWCSVGGEVQPCPVPAAGTMRCCKMAP